jgi:hypothetical protein
MGPELLAAGLLPEDENKQTPVEDEPVDVLEDFGETGVYEVSGSACEHQQACRTSQESSPTWQLTQQ